jgi:hypothetical protein
MCGKPFANWPKPTSVPYVKELVWALQEYVKHDRYELA